WVAEDGGLHPAPNTRLINYFQYPEVRLSGFLKGCDRSPDALRRRSQAKYGKRILALGVSASDGVIGIVLTERDDPAVADFPELPQSPGAPIFQVLTVGAPAGAEPLDLLRADLSKIFGAGWHPSVILKPGAVAPIPFVGAQGAGYTLEALLGVAAN